VEGEESDGVKSELSLFVIEVRGGGDTGMEGVDVLL